MHRRVLLASAFGACFVAQPIALRAEGRVVRIGWLTAQRPESLTPYVKAFRAGLANLGYVEGRNLQIEFRYGDDVIERVPGLAAELVRLPVDIIVVQGAAVPILAELKLPVPIVYAFSGDPIVAGFAESLAHPRGNMTGLSFMAAELTGKRLELLREIMPDLHRVALVARPEHPGEHLERAYSEDTARQLAITTTYFPTSTDAELAAAFARLRAEPPQAISLFADAFALQNRQRIIDFAMELRVPVISGWPVFAENGALCTYGPRLDDSYRRLAYYVDRIVKGAKPTDLPIERPTQFELVVNLKSARALELTIPPTVMARADRVIE
jgi:putative ABC transport system substrate-binding protein